MNHGEATLYLDSVQYNGRERVLTQQHAAFHVDSTLCLSSEHIRLTNSRHKPVSDCLNSTNNQELNTCLLKLISSQIYHFDVGHFFIATFKLTVFRQKLRFFQFYFAFIF